METRILLYSDQPMSALGLRRALEGKPYVLLSADTLDGALHIIRETNPEIVLIELPCSYAVVCQVKDAMKVGQLALWAKAAEIRPEFAFQMVRLGVRGFIRKHLSTAEQIEAIGKVQAGELVVEKTLADEILCGARQVNLTPREGQLVALIGDGLQNKEIARRLTITEGTVKVYLSRLFDKLGCAGRFELMAWARHNLGGDSGATCDRPPCTILRPVEAR